MTLAQLVEDLALGLVDRDQPMGRVEAVHLDGGETRTARGIGARAEDDEKAESGIQTRAKQNGHYSESKNLL